MQRIQLGEQRLGVVYTPAHVTEPMVRVALAPLLAGRSSDEICALRICDPAIGEGAFLAAARDVIAERLVALAMPRAAAERAASRCLVGVDIDPRAVAVAAARVGGDLRVGDALALDWAQLAPGGFDAVIGNPPYVRQEHLAVHKPALRRFDCYDGVADLYVYFIELAHRIARPGGRYCLITPNKWLTAAYGRPLRSYLAEQRSIEGIVDVARAFDDADAFPCIVWGTIGGADDPIRAARIESTAGVELATVGELQPRARFATAPWHIDPAVEHALIERLEARWPRLGDLVPERPARGVVTGCNRAFVIDRHTRDHLLAAEPDAAPLVRPLVKGRDLRRWVPAAVDRYVLLIDRGTSLDELPHVLAHLAQFRTALEPRPPAWRGPWHGRKPGAYRWFELQDPVGAIAKARTPRLFYQDIQTEPACCIDRAGELVPDTTVWCVASSDLYLLALLNSPLYGWYARRRFPPALNGSVRPKLDYIRGFPVATPSITARTAIERLVEQRLDHAEPGLEAAIASAVLDVYELDRADRRRITRAAEAG